MGVFMSTSAEFSKFAQACDQMADSKIMQVSAKVKAILKAIVASETLYNLFEY